MVESEIKTYSHDDDGNEEDKTDDIYNVPHGAEILCHPSSLYLLSFHQNSTQHKSPQDVLLNCDIRFGGGVAEPEDDN